MCFRLYRGCSRCNRFTRYSALHPLQRASAATACFSRYSVLQPLQRASVTTACLSSNSVLQPLQCASAATACFSSNSVLQSLQCASVATVCFSRYSVLQPIQFNRSGNSDLFDKARSKVNVGELLVDEVHEIVALLSSVRPLAVVGRRKVERLVDDVNIFTKFRQHSQRGLD